MSAFKFTSMAIFILLLCHLERGASFGQAAGPDSPPAAGPPPGEDAGAGRPTAVEEAVRSSSLIRLEEHYRFIPETIPREGAHSGDGVEKKIYLLQFESDPPESRELLRMQENLLKNQLAMIRVLGILGEHQGKVGQRLARMENRGRETTSILMDTARGVDSSRLDIAGNLVATRGVAEISQEINREVIEIRKQLEDIGVAIDGLTETTGEILDTVESIEGGTGL